MRIIFLSCLLLFTLGAGRSHEVVWFGSEDEARQNGDSFDWQSRGPLEFIDHLKSTYDSDGLNIYTVYSYHRGWVQESDLPALRELAESEEPCRAVISPLDSFLPPEGSTVGAIASELLASYADGGYPTWMKESAEAFAETIQEDDDAAEPN